MPVMLLDNPWREVSDALIARRNSKIQLVGDSTGQGLRTVSTPDPLHGWFGRFGLDIANGYDVNYRYLGAAYPGSVSWPGYNQNEMMRTSVREDAPTLEFWNGSIGGAQGTNLVSWINSYNLIPDPDTPVVMVACGFNDAIHAASVLSRLQAVVAAIRAKCPNAQIILTDENRSTGTYPTSFFAAQFSAVSNYYVGQPINTTPALIRSEVAGAEGVWFLDSQQFYTHTPLTEWMTLNDTVGGLHPNSDGYQAQADGTYGLFPDPIPPAPVITATDLDLVMRAVFFSQTFAAISYGNPEWSIAGVIPHGLSFDAAEGTLSGTPTSFGGAFQFTITVEDEYGSDNKTFIGEVAPNGFPFMPTTVVRTKFKSPNGFWYPSVRRRRRPDGSWIPVVTRC